VWFWSAQRVADPEGFNERLDLPLDTDPATVVTRSELDRDAENFMAFAKAFGVVPNGDTNGPAQLPSSTT
jgi:hypothetical protein